MPEFDLIYKKVLQIPGVEAIQPNLQQESRMVYDSVHEFKWKLPARGIRAGRLPYYEGKQPERAEGSINITPKTIKIFCSICDSVQPYNFMYGSDVLEDDFQDNSLNIQVFFLAYMCQSCKSSPEVFMIRREKMKITHSGRTPIEKVDVPKIIPNAQKEFFSDAVILFNAGKILAGKFLLRTVIEQYIRDFTNNKTSQNLEELFDEYSASLPDDFKQRFPSLTNIYSQLSADIHSANSDKDLFIKSQQDIQEHFDAKRLFKIS